MISKLKLSFCPMITFLCFIPSLAAQQIPPNATAYDILQQFGLPIGLLPSSVKSYTFNPDDGRFTVVLTKQCYIQSEYYMHYDDKITGVIKYGSITKLNGIQVRRSWFWIDVGEIKLDARRSDLIVFQFGLIAERLDVKQFQNVRVCGDAFEFGFGGGNEVKSIPPVEAANRWIS